MKKIVVIGAGIGGLSTASVLAKSGEDVTVLEAHVYPGGCAGTFYHQGYRFEAGATLAGGFYPGGPMDILAKACGINEWPTRPADPAMSILLPEGQRITRWSTNQSRIESRNLFGPGSDKFWDWQEQTADALWNLALRKPAWPPQSLKQAFDMFLIGAGWLFDQFPSHLKPELFADAFRSVSSHLKGMPELFKLYIDAQLLIASQTTSDYTYALYGASALDLPRRGVVHLEGGIGGIAQSLSSSIRAHGGKIHFRSEVTRIERKSQDAFLVHTKNGKSFPADVLIVNLPPWNIMKLLDAPKTKKLRTLARIPNPGWGAYMVYVGLENGIVPENLPLHQQVITKRPLGEGNSIFLSLSPNWDSTRAPEGHRALTISTHTDLVPWWQLYEKNRQGYDERKKIYTDRILKTAELAIPGLGSAAQLIMGGTPVTFQRFTRRSYGWVGGFPQTHLTTSWGPIIEKNLWMVGDSIFPGQSTAAVALGGLRVAKLLRSSF